MIGGITRFQPLLWLLVLLLSLLLATMGSAAASAERGDFGCSSLAAKSGVRLSEKGLNLVENHLSKFDFPPNQGMMQRLRTSFANGEKVTGADANFYLHEANEATTIGRLGYEGAHPAALQKYGVKEFDLYHPEVIQANPQWFNSNWRSYWGLPNP